MERKPSFCKTTFYCKLGTKQNSMLELFREPASTLISAPWNAVILDRGVLKKAIKNSKGQYLFSEVGAGVQPLVIVGTLPQLVDFFYTHKETVISNEIESLPDIYIGISKYVEKKRFDGTYPIHDAIQALTKSILDFVPGNTLTDALSNAATFGSLLKELITGSKPLPPKATDLLYLKISYLNDTAESGKKIGTKKTNFEVITRYLLGIKETSV